MATYKTYTLQQTLSNGNTIDVDFTIPVDTNGEYELNFVMEAGSGEMSVITPSDHIVVDGMYKQYEINFNYVDGYIASQVVTIDIPGKLQYPSYSIVSNTSSYIQIQFKNPNSVTATIRYKLSTASSWYSSTVVAGGTATATFSGLNANTNYMVYAYCASINTNTYFDSTQIQIDVTTAKEKLAAPTISLNARGTTWITAQYNNTANVAVTLYAQVVEKSTGWQTRSLSALNSDTIYFDALSAGQGYTFQAYVSATGYEDSAITSVTLRPYYGKLSAPAVSNDTDSTPDIKVTNNNSVSVSSYYSTSPSGSGTYSKTISANGSSWTNHSFDWNTTYYFKFTATDWQDSDWSAGQKPGNKLLSPQVTIHANFADVTNPNGVAAILYYRPNYSGTNTNGGSIDANSTITIGGLSGGTTYYFFFIQNNQYLESDYTTASTLAPLTAPTLKVDSDSIADIYVTNTNSVSVDVYYRKNGVDTYWGTLTAGSSKWFSSGIAFGDTIGVWFANSSYPNSSVSEIYVQPNTTLTLVAPVCDYDYDDTIDIKVTNNNSVSVNVYYNTTGSNTSGTLVGTLSANQSSWMTHSNWNFSSAYYIYFTATGYNNSPATYTQTGWYEEETTT